MSTYDTEERAMAIAEAYDGGRRDGEAAAMERIVAWLRTEANKPYTRAIARELLVAAALVEAGAWKKRDNDAREPEHA